MCFARSKFLLVLMAVLLTLTSGATRWYVNANNDPTDPNNPSRGKTWELAFTDFQEALDIAAAGDEIWVAKSTPAQAAYVPSARYPNDPNDPRRATFLIPAGVRVYGGFRGLDSTDPNFPGESDLSQRDPDHNLTILDGDLEQNDDPNSFPFGATFADNAYHVVFIHGTLGESITKLSGFVIRNGHADGLDEDLNPAGEIPDDMGGGVISLFPDVGLASEPRLDRLILDRNYADVAGAGILLAGKNGSVPLANCRFQFNWVGDPDDPNLPDGYGAGLAVHKEHVGGATVQNAIFFANHIVRGTGAGVAIPGANLIEFEFSNCTFYGNQCDTGPTGPSDTLAGAFYCPRNTGGTVLIPSARISNCIVWGNTEPQLGEAVDACYCDVEDASYWADPNNPDPAEPPTPCSLTNIARNPLFRSASTGNLTLSYFSPCIDFGALFFIPDPNNPNEVPIVLDDLTDLDEQNGTNELIPREMLYPRGRILADDPNTTWTGQIDRGAYELSGCPGDIDADGDCDLVDLTLLLSVYGEPCAAVPYDPYDTYELCVRDLDGDAVFDLEDLTILLREFGTSCVPVPPGAPGGGENSMTSGADPLTEWLRSATAEEVLDWWYAGMPPVGGNGQ